MVRFGIITSYATSLTVVGKDLAYTISKLGHESKFYSRQIQWYDAKKEFDRGIVLIPFDPIYAPIWFLLARDYNVHGLPSVVYTTVEGEPKQWLVKDWIKRDCKFIANSNFTQKMLRRIDIDVAKVIYHGVNFELVNQVKHQAETKKQAIKQQLGVKTLFGTIASGHPRKGLAHLTQTLQAITSKIKDVGFYILTTPHSIDQFKEIKNVYASPKFGKLTREEVVTLIGSFDFLIHPALCEGFCLPVLEAQALGVPCIYPAYEPITEIAHPTANFPVKTTSEDFQDLGDGILYLCHFYKPEDMAEQIEKAYETYTCKPDEYQKLSKQVTEHAKNFDTMKCYKDFIKA
jgi:glycosyltransferase involved in cell wall biosynthesis